MGNCTFDFCNYLSGNHCILNMFIHFSWDNLQLTNWKNSFLSAIVSAVKRALQHFLTFLKDKLRNYLSENHCVLNMVIHVLWDNLQLTNWTNSFSNARVSAVKTASQHFLTFLKDKFRNYLLACWISTNNSKGISVGSTRMSTFAWQNVFYSISWRHR